MKKFIKKELGSIVKRLAISAMSKAEILIGKGKGNVKLDLATKFTVNDLALLPLSFKAGLIRTLLPMIFKNIIKEILQEVFSEAKKEINEGKSVFVTPFRFVDESRLK